MHACIPTYLHTYIHTYIFFCANNVELLREKIPPNALFLSKNIVYTKRFIGALLLAWPVASGTTRIQETKIEMRVPISTSLKGEGIRRSRLTLTCLAAFPRISSDTHTIEVILFVSSNAATIVPTRPCITDGLRNERA